MLDAAVFPLWVAPVDEAVPLAGVVLPVVVVRGVFCAAEGALEVDGVDLPVAAGVWEGLGVAALEPFLLALAGAVVFPLAGAGRGITLIGPVCVELSVFFVEALGLAELFFFVSVVFWAELGCCLEVDAVVPSLFWPPVCATALTASDAATTRI